MSRAHLFMETERELMKVFVVSLIFSLAPTRSIKSIFREPVTQHKASKEKPGRDRTAALTKGARGSAFTRMTSRSGLKNLSKREQI